MVLNFDYLTDCSAMTQVVIRSIPHSCLTKTKDIRFCFMYDRGQLRTLKLAVQTGDFIFRGDQRHLPTLTWPHLSVRVWPSRLLLHSQTVLDSWLRLIYWPTAAIPILCLQLRCILVGRRFSVLSVSLSHQPPAAFLSKACVYQIPSSVLNGENCAIWIVQGSIC